MVINMIQGKKTAPTFSEIESDSSDPLTSIKNACGELCDTSRKGTPGQYFDHG